MRSFIVIAVLLAAAIGAGLLIMKSRHHQEPLPAPSPEAGVLVISADTAGWIMPCGCTANQSGGLLRRATYLQRLGKDGLPILCADAGGAPAGTSSYQKVKFEAVLEGELAMGLAAHNLGRSEVLLGPEYLRDVASRLKVPFVSANTLDSAGKPITQAARIVSWGSRKIALVGVLSPGFATPGITITEPRQAILSALSPLKGSYSSLVVLAYLPENELRQLASDLPEADAVVGGPTHQAFAPRLVGPTLMAASTNKGKFLVRLDIPAGSGKWSGDVVEMGPDIPDAAAQQQNLHRYLARLGQLDLGAADSGLVEPIAAGAPAGYRVAGSESCAKCHTAEYSSWQASPHAQAWGKLTARGFEVDSYCQQCHTTGYGLPDGFDNVHRSANRVNVGCEDCHGPSLAHVSDPGVHTPFAASARDQCIRCHDHENSPHFDFAAYWPKIIHGSKGHS